MRKLAVDFSCNETDFQSVASSLHFLTLGLNVFFFSFYSGATYKFVCFKLDEMGGVGENLLHLCLLNSSSIHSELARRLLKYYPNLMNDIYISDEYFGEFVYLPHILCDNTNTYTQPQSRQMKFHFRREPAAHGDRRRGPSVCQIPAG